ncbi:MAG TPA: AHH domain-containing protein [Archangium sp.]|nr:AHH domain-containing protein [Archangium sp.]
MAESTKHVEFLGQTIPHHPSGTVTGGKCFAKGHKSDYDENCSCSHRWQAFEKAVDNADLYRLTDKQVRALGGGTWMLFFRGGDDDASDLANRGRTVARFLLNKQMYLLEVPKPKVGDWDVARSKRNFKSWCNLPYYHEAHHVVPDATLRDELLRVFGEEGGGSNEFAIWVVTGLLHAPYNIHYKDNMIILPMDERVGDVLQLPIHRETKQCNHTSYDEYIGAQLKSRLRAQLREVMKKHDEEKGEPKLKDLAESIEALSRQLYDEVSKARREGGFRSIEQMGQIRLSLTK